MRRAKNRKVELDEAHVMRLIKKMGYKFALEFYADMGADKVDPGRFLNSYIESTTHTGEAEHVSAEEFEIRRDDDEKKSQNDVLVIGEKSINGLSYRFARCCNPVPGDDIVGFITRGFGVSIHKKDCTNVVNADLSSDRWVRTEWASTVKETFKSTIDIIGSDRQGLLADVSVTLSNMRVPIHTFMARETKDNHSHIQVTIGISDLEQLRSIMSSLRKISGVVSVQRSNQPTV